MKTPPPSFPSSSGDESLEQLLRQNTATTQLRDDGFTTRVLIALPPVKPHRPAVRVFSRRNLLCFAGAVAGVCLARPDLGALSTHLVNAPAILDTFLIQQAEFWDQSNTISNLLILLGVGGLLYWLDRTSPDQV